MTDGSDNELYPFLLKQNPKSKCEETDIEGEEYGECYELANQWPMFLLDDCYWTDSRRPYVKVRNFEDLILTDYEERGILSDRIIACFSSYLDKSPEISHYALCKCDLSTVEILTDISILKYYHYFQYLNLSNNKIEDLSALGEMPFLTYLNVSHNEITTLLDFKPPYNLTYVNFSYNKIQEIKDLDEFWSIKVLILAHNNIKAIRGVKNLRYLRVLNLSSNKIYHVENLDNMRLRELYLQNNLISTFEMSPEYNLQTLQHIRIIDMSSNNISTLLPFEGLFNIEILNLASNNIEHLLEIAHLEGLRYLVKLKLLGNPIAQNKHYFRTCTFYARNVQILDDEYISLERLACVKEVDHSVLKASTARSYLVALQNLNSTEITPEILPYDKQRKPVLLLIGLPGCGIKQVMRELIATLSFVKRGVGHTTRPKTALEEDGVDYYFITREEFQRKVTCGDFVTTNNIGGYYYGIDRSEFQRYVNYTMVFHTNFQSALMMKLKGYSPRLIFCLPKSKETHLAWLKRNYLYYYNDRDCHLCVEFNPPAVEEAKKLASEYEHGRTIKAMKQISTELVEEAIRQAEIKKTKTLKKTKSKRKKKTVVSPRKTVEVHNDQIEEMDSTEPPDKIMDVNKVQLYLLDVPRTPNNTTAGSNFVGDPDDNTEILYSLSQTLPSDTNSEIQPIQQNGQSLVLNVLSNTEITQGKCGKFCEDIKKQVAAYYDSILRERDELIEYHISNTGIFHDVIYTDDLEGAIIKLKKFIKTILKYEVPPAEAVIKGDAAQQHILNAKLEAMHHLINLYLQVREQWRITDVLFNPMMIMLILPTVLIMILPKMMNDPETKKEMEQIENLTKFEMPEMGDYVSNYLTGNGGQSSSEKTKKAIKNKKRQ